jgi:ABC-type transport system involved in multi-copper enzyme maturation permease subunit
MKGNYPNGARITFSFVKWEFVRTLYNLPNYGAIFLSLCVAWLMLNGTFNTVRQSGLLVAANPFLVPFLTTLLPYAIFLALAVAVSLAREIESRTLEVLFFAPIRFASFVIGRFLGQMTYYFIALALVLTFFLGYAHSANLRVTAGLLGAMALSPFTVASVVGFGFLVASMLRRTRLTVVVLLAIILILLSLQFAHAVLPTMQSEETSATVIALTDVVNGIYGVIQWISPFAYLARGVDAAQIGSPSLYAMVFIGSLLYSLMMLVLSIWILRRRGFSR